MLGAVVMVSPFRLAPARTTCACGIGVYGALLVGFANQFQGPIYQPARNVMGLAIWGAIAVAAAASTLFGLYLRPVTWRPLFGAPQAVWMLTWTALQVVAVVSHAFGESVAPGSPVIWSTVTGMFLLCFLHDP